MEENTVYSTIEINSLELQFRSFNSTEIVRERSDIQNWQKETLQQPIAGLIDLREISFICRSSLSSRFVDILGFVQPCMRNTF
jgi:hypothetical protein